MKTETETGLSWGLLAAAGGANMIGMWWAMREARALHWAEYYNETMAELVGANLLLPRCYLEPYETWDGPEEWAWPLHDMGFD